MYIGRIERSKGVFDILQIAQKVEFEAPGRVRWEICGSGPDLDDLRRKQVHMSLADVVIIRGWTSPSDLRDVYARSHLLVVPTRSNFSEGLAMVAAEATRSGRPVITNPVVPALEILKPACIEARTDDVDSYAAAILNLIDNPSQYRALCAMPGPPRTIFRPSTRANCDTQKGYRMKRLHHRVLTGVLTVRMRRKSE